MGASVVSFLHTGRAQTPEPLSSTATPAPSVLKLEFEPIRDFQQYAQLKSLLSTRLLPFGTLTDHQFKAGQVTLLLQITGEAAKTWDGSNLVRDLEATELPRLTGRPAPERLLIRNKPEHPASSDGETLHVSIVE